MSTALYQLTVVFKTSLAEIRRKIGCPQNGAKSSSLHFYRITKCTTANELSLWCKTLVNSVIFPKLSPYISLRTILSHCIKFVLVLNVLK